jgi:hypothetical protein
VRPLDATLQGPQLVAEGKIFEDHVVVATAGHGDGAQKQQCQCKHVLILWGVAAESNTGAATTTFWRTTLNISYRLGECFEESATPCSGGHMMNLAKGWLWAFSTGSAASARPRSPETFETR